MYRSNFLTPFDIFYLNIDIFLFTDYAIVFLLSQSINLFSQMLL